MSLETITCEVDGETFDVTVCYTPAERGSMTCPPCPAYADIENVQQAGEDLVPSERLLEILYRIVNTELGIRPY